MRGEINIRGIIDYNSIKINSFNVEESYPAIQIQCDIDCAVKNIYSESYYRGGTLYGLTPIKITELSLNPKDSYIEDISEIDESVIRDALDALKFDVDIDTNSWSDVQLGGGIYCGADDLEENNYTEFYFDELIMYIASESAIKVLQSYVEGENYSVSYFVVDANDDIIADDFDDDYDAAVEYAIENGGHFVLSKTTWFTYKIYDDGHIGEYYYEVDDDNAVEWDSDDYY